MYVNEKNCYGNGQKKPTKPSGFLRFHTVFSRSRNQFLSNIKTVFFRCQNRFSPLSKRVFFADRKTDNYCSQYRFWDRQKLVCDGQKTVLGSAKIAFDIGKSGFEENPVVIAGTQNQFFSVPRPVFPIPRPVFPIPRPVFPIPRPIFADIKTSFCRFKTGFADIKTSF